MRLLSLVRIAIFLVVLAVVAIGLIPFPARTLTFEAQHCSCQIPYNWIIKDQAHFLIQAKRILGGSFVLDARPLTETVDVTAPSYANIVKSGLIADGHDKFSDNTAPFEGHPAYTFNFHKVINGHDIYTHSITFVADQYQYTMAIATTGSDPTRDSGLMAAVNSFTLLDNNPATTP